MAVHTVAHSWTLGGLIRAFVDLSLAYLMLCVSASGFFALKTLSVFGLYLPCPCNGPLGYQSSNLCLQKLLIDWLMRTIYSVQNSAKSSFPFNLIWFNDQACNLDVKCDSGVVELEGEACSSSFSGSRLQNLVDKESGYDAKGKRIMNQKQRTGIRRRRRVALGSGNSFSASLADSRQSVFVGVSSSPYNGCEMRSEISESLDPVSVIEDGLQGESEMYLKDNASATNGLDPREKTWHGFELREQFEESKETDKESSSAEKFIYNAQDKPGIVGNEANTIRMLEQALEEEKAARAALYLELEKERAAAATATDEAMAMILRLQEDKASIEMEARQYQRMIEEKFSYDEDEMNILKDILVRKERENHFLEKEIEAYRQMVLLGNEQSEGDFSNVIDKARQRLVQPSEMSLNLIQSSPHGHGLPEKTIVLAGKEKAGKDDGIVCQGMISEAAQTCSGIEKNCSCGGEELEKDGEHGDEKGGNFHGSMLDIEPTVYDVHVIDDKTELRKEERRKEGGRSNFVASGSGVWRSEVSSDCQSTSKAETEPYIHTSSLDMSNRLPVLGNSQEKTLLSNSGRNSSSAANSEILKIETEVEWLRQRLRIVQEEKEKLTFSAEHRERVNAQLKLVEEIVNQLQQIQQLREPVRHTSLPPSSSKVSLEKRRCRSVPWEDP